MEEVMSTAKKFSISISYVLYASPEKVFEALTREGIIGQWCDGGGKVENEVDGAIEMFDGWVKGKVLKFSANKKLLSYTWKPSEWDKKTAPSIVTYTFKEHAAGTELLIEHTNFPSQEEADKHLNGWTDFVLEPLNDYFTS
jgi:uncharacterized protein YndB with AHSA1/START domain